MVKSFYSINFIFFLLVLCIGCRREIAQNNRASHGEGKQLHSTIETNPDERTA